MDLQPLTAERGIIIAGILGGLAITSWVFNSYIDREADQEPLGPNTGMYVVIGDAYTLIGAFAIFWLLFGLQNAAWILLVLFGCFIVAGLPMLFGAQKRGRRLRSNYELHAKPLDAPWYQGLEQYEDIEE